MQLNRKFAEDRWPVGGAVGDWWAFLIVRDALTGKRRFGEFHRSPGGAKNILTARLKKLVADGCWSGPGGGRQRVWWSGRSDTESDEFL